MSKRAEVKIYHGFGHTHNLIVFGHVFRKKPAVRFSYRDNLFVNIYHLLRLFTVKPLPDVPVQLVLEDQVVKGKTEKDGFFKFEWSASHEINAGWHPVVANSLDDHGNVVATGEGKVFIPHSTQYGFISDIDDTVMISHSATIWRRLRELFVKNAHTRNAFKDVGKHYSLLAEAHTDEKTQNPFFYVSSSEWNLYDYLRDFFDHNKLPQGAFLLNQIKQWFQLFKTGKTKHDGKLIRIVRILDAFPKQKFILFGDNTQRDPFIYAAIAEKFPGHIFAVYIRNVVPSNERKTQEALDGLTSKGIHTCQFKESAEAIEHSQQIGLI
ncbi:MAG: App1 family protein [Chitinophagaceae bacterium]|nr:App1 family protein [Chitinophagaceae bacterium]